MARHFNVLHDQQPGCDDTPEPEDLEGLLRNCHPDADLDSGETVALPGDVSIPPCSDGSGDDSEAECDSVLSYITRIKQLPQANAETNHALLLKAEEQRRALIKIALRDQAALQHLAQALSLSLDLSRKVIAEEEDDIILYFASLSKEGIESCQMRLDALIKAPAAQTMEEIIAGILALRPTLYAFGAIARVISDEHCHAEFKHEYQQLRATYNALSAFNQRLVLHVASRFPCSYRDFLDAVQDGNLGLLRAIDRFDLSKNCAFSTYAFHWIRALINRNRSTRTSVIRLPAYAHAILDRARVVAEKKGAAIRSQTVISEVARELGIPENTIDSIVAADQEIISIHRTDRKNPNDEYIIDCEDEGVVSPIEVVAIDQLRRDIASALSVLPPVLRKTVAMYFGFDGYQQHTMAAIARVFKVSRERVRQRLKQAIDMLRKPWIANVLIRHLDP